MGYLCLIEQSDKFAAKIRLFLLESKSFGNFAAFNTFNNGTVMSSVNKVILIGNVGSDPEVRYLDRGSAIANFNLATTERGYTMQNGTQVPDRTEWHAIVLWRNLAEWAEKYVRKGMKLYVEGKLQTRTWEKDGQIRRKTEIIAENVQVLYRPAESRTAAPAGQEDASVASDSEPESTLS